MDDIVRDVADVLQRGYGDATQTVLDREVAGSVVRHLRKLGWASPGEVAAIVVAAGGRVEVPDRLLVDPPAGLWSSYSHRNFSLVLTAN